MLYIGVDLGHVSGKTAYDGQRRERSRRSCPKNIRLYFPHPGWSEQNPEDWFDAVRGRHQRTDC